MSLPSKSKVVIVGGGVIGTSVAYNLAKLGCTDVVLLERDKLTSGTTWHAAGLIGQLRHTKIETTLCAEAVKMYTRLEEETGLSTGFKQCGSLTTASTRERFEVLKRNAIRAKSYGLEADIMTPEECGKTMSHDGVDLLRTDDLQGGLWLPNDGSGSPTDLTMALAAGARMNGVSIIEGVGVTGFNTATVAGAGKRVHGVETAQGTIECDQIVLCGGQWSRQLGAMAGVNVPLHTCEHFYVTTEKMPGVHPGLPVYRDNDAYAYFREWGEGLLVGGFELEAKPIWTEGVPKNFAFNLLPDDPEHFMQIWDGAQHRIPSLEHAPINTFVNGPESFTTDNQYIVGESPDCKNFYVAAGFNSAGIANAAGAGMITAEWVMTGKPPLGRDVWGVDIRRFGEFARSPMYLRERVAEVLGLHYAMPWPRKELETARGLRRSALHTIHEGNGAGMQCVVYGVWGRYAVCSVWCMGQVCSV
jgi:4-methylaminobutanoate oxidase (formaldehyde-forming)